jgi:CheY-like chemotaxis protein
MAATPHLRRRRRGDDPRQHRRILGRQRLRGVGAATGATRSTSSTAPTAPCLILLDLMMPVMDGRSFREQQLQNPELAAIPWSSSRVPGRRQDAGELNAAGHLAKPLEPDDLLQTVRRYCSNGGAAPGPA